MKYVSYENDANRQLEKAASQMLLAAGYEADSLPKDKRRRKEQVEYNRRTIHTPCGGWRRKLR